LNDVYGSTDVDISHIPGCVISLPTVDTPATGGATPCPRSARCVLERVFAWLNRNRRLAKDVETTIASAASFHFAASVMLTTRRIARIRV
jgi:hypothetical protein